MTTSPTKRNVSEILAEMAEAADGQENATPADVDRWASVLGEEIHRLHDFVKKVSDNFKQCEYCGGTGKNPHSDIDDECPKCNNGLRINSVGVMFVEIPQEAADLIWRKK